MTDLCATSSSETANEPVDTSAIDTATEIKRTRPRDFLFDFEKGCEDADPLGYDRKSKRDLLIKAASKRGLLVDIDESDDVSYDRRSRRNLLNKAMSQQSLLSEGSQGLKTMRSRRDLMRRTGSRRKSFRKHLDSSSKESEGPQRARSCSTAPTETVM